MPASYVIGTHALLWFLQGSSRLGAAARRAMEEPQVQLVFPAIALAEALWLIEHRRVSLPPGVDLLTVLDADPRLVLRQSDEEALETIRRAIPPEHVEFLKTFIDTCRFGDYLFVHAGIRPGVSIDEQLQSDLRWIREPFLFDDTDHGCVVVHGHTIREEVEERSNRIGIDTGAYRTGVLTALVIEGDRRWYLQTSETAHS